MRVEIALAERERLLDAKPTTPEDDDHGAQATAVATTSNLAHHGEEVRPTHRAKRNLMELMAGLSR